MNNKINSAEDFEKWKANQKLDKQKHVAKIKQIEKLEDKIEYWLLNMESESFFTIDKSDQINLLDHVTHKERPEVIKAEIRRLDATNKDFLSVRIRSKFYDRIKETNDLELTKTKFIDTINKHIDIKEFADIYTMAKLKGFDRYKGGRSIEQKAEDLRSFSIGDENRIMFGHIYEGYLLAELVSEINQIKQNSKVIQVDNRIDVNITAEKFAALMYLLSTKGVFDLAYFDFNTNYYNGEETVKLCQKHFKIISQKGKTKGEEVSIETLKKAFKKSVIKETLETGIDNLFEALANLPKLNK